MPFKCPTNPYLNVDYFSSFCKDILSSLHAERARILLQIEQTWRLKSHVVWLEVGYNNTKLFHRFANQRRISNSIWEIKNQDGIFLSEQLFIKEESVRYFQGIYSHDQCLNIPQQLKILKNFSKFFSIEEGLKVGAEVSKEEAKH